MRRVLSRGNRQDWNFHVERQKLDIPELRHMTVQNTLLTAH